MKIILVDSDPVMVEAWVEATKANADVEIMKGDPLRASADALVCPGDGFGLMAGAAGNSVSVFAGLVAMRWSHIGKSIRHGVASPPHCGELAIGHAVMVPTGTNDFRWVIYAPDCSGFGAFEHGPDALRSFRATRAALSLIRLSGAMLPQHKLRIPVVQAVESIAIPPIGREPGYAGALNCARQMAFAIRHMDSKLTPGSRADVHGWINEMGR